MQAHGGLMSVTGHAGAPARVGTSVIDMGTALWCAIGVLAALRERDRTGEGAHVVASLFETALAWNAYHLLGYLAGGAVPSPSGTAFPLIAPYEAFLTADGQLMIAAANDGLFRKFCGALGRPDLAADPRFRDNPSRVRHRAALVAAVTAETRSRHTTDLTDLLRRAGVPCAPILDIAAVAADDQTQASGLIGEIGDGSALGQRTVLPPLAWDGARVRPERPAPALNAHADEILSEYGLAAGEIATLRASGALP
jgi:crotonobetainyl-CoA:carnitine CoA-transferase CaiB-like acyl-CoA transferase